MASPPLDTQTIPGPSLCPRRGFSSGVLSGEPWPACHLLPKKPRFWSQKTWVSLLLATACLSFMTLDKSLDSSEPPFPLNGVCVLCPLRVVN